MTDPDLSGRITFIVDESAEPVDIDAAVADFLISIFSTEITNQPAPKTGNPEADGGDGTG